MVTHRKNRLRCNGYNKGKCSNSSTLVINEVCNLITNIIEKQLNQLLEKEKSKEELSKTKKSKIDTRKKEIIENRKKVHEVLTNETISIKEKYEIAHHLINKVEYDASTNTLELYYN